MVSFSLLDIFLHGDSTIPKQTLKNKSLSRVYQPPTIALHQRLISIYHWRGAPRMGGLNPKNSWPTVAGQFKPQTLKFPNHGLLPGMKWTFLTRQSLQPYGFSFDIRPFSNNIPTTNILNKTKKHKTNNNIQKQPKQSLQTLKIPAQPATIGYPPLHLPFWVMWARG